MASLEHLSSYQNPEGLLQDRLAPRTDKRLSMFDWGMVYGKTVLDLGCNNGYFTRMAMKNGAKRAVGVDVSDAVVGARELAKEEGVKAEFWQTDLDSPEFRRWCPEFDVVYCLSVITHVNDKEEFLNWLDSRVRHTLVFESNHGESNKKHIELVKKYMHFFEVNYLGPSDIPEKPHHLWVCKKWNHNQRYPFLQDIPVEFVPISTIEGWTEDSLVQQVGGYDRSDQRYKDLVTDIKRMGVRNPIIVREKDGKIVGFQGCHRYFAAKELGYKDIPCKVIRGLWFKHLDK